MAGNCGFIVLPGIAERILNPMDRAPAYPGFAAVQRGSLLEVSARFVASGVLALCAALVGLLGGASIVVIAAEDSTPAPIPAAAARPAPPVLVGPCRVTLTGGKTIDGIAVFREDSRVRVVLEDGTKIMLDPAKVTSVVSLADIDETAAPPVKNIEAAPATSSAKKKKTATSASASGTSSKPGGSGSAAKKSVASGDGAKRMPAVASKSDVKNAKSTAPVNRTASAAPAARTAAGVPAAPAAHAAHAASSAEAANPDAGSNDAENPGGANAAAANGAQGDGDKDVEVAELANMLAAAINNADLEGGNGWKVGGDGGQNAAGGAGEEGASGDGEGAAGYSVLGASGNANPAARGTSAARQKPNRRSQGFDAAKKASGQVVESMPEDDVPAPDDIPDTPPSDVGQYQPTPEELDATVPVRVAGFRFLGPKGEEPSTPPQNPDFPKPATPSTSFKTPTWKPVEGFGPPAKWPTQLAPATSFGNQLSGWGRPTTSFGPDWWFPTPALWSPAQPNQYWAPTDGFAQKEKQKSELLGPAPSEPAPAPASH